MTIITKANLHLWLLTGRYDKFRNQALNAGISYKSSAPPAEVVACRNLLKLADTRSDFYVLGALAAAKASAPFLRRLPADGCLAFTEELVTLPPVTVDGAAAISPDATRMATFGGKHAGRDGYTEVSVTRSGDGVIIRSDAGMSTFGECSVSGNIVTVPALRTMGIDARFVVAGWVEGQTFTIQLAQTHYPYDKFATTIADSFQAIQLMLEEGTMEAFASSVRPIHKVGALVCAIMLRMARLTATAGLDFVIEIIRPPADQGGDTYDNQLSVNWSPIFYEGGPVTYNLTP
jgi:hypothetical protein